MKPRLPSFPMEELQRINYGEGFVAERVKLPQQARRMAEQDMNMAHQNKNWKIVTKCSLTTNYLCTKQEIFHNVDWPICYYKNHQ